jgi:hypothetical protein
LFFHETTVFPKVQWSKKTPETIVNIGFDMGCDKDFTKGLFDRRNEHSTYMTPWMVCWDPSDVNKVKLRAHGYNVNDGAPSTDSKSYNMTAGQGTLIQMKVTNTALSWPLKIGTSPQSMKIQNIIIENNAGPAFVWKSKPDGTIIKSAVASEATKFDMTVVSQSVNEIQCIHLILDGSSKILMVKDLDYAADNTLTVIEGADPHSPLNVVCFKSGMENLKIFGQNAYIKNPNADQSNDVRITNAPLTGGSIIWEFDSAAGTIAYLLNTLNNDFGDSTKWYLDYSEDSGVHWQPSSSNVKQKWIFHKLWTNDPYTVTSTPTMCQHVEITENNTDPNVNPRFLQ